MNKSVVLKSFYAKDRKVWRKWLEKNHAASPGVWLIYYKKSSGRLRIPYEEAVEEALCFGWIDSTTRPGDADSFIQRFTPRKPKSIWSALNKNRVEKLISEGLMTTAGLAKIEAAKKDGSWNSLNAVNSHVDSNNIPGDLLKAFGRNRKTLANFKAFTASVRRQFLYWIDTAKRPETRAIRIKQTVLMSTANKKPGIKGFKL